MQSIPGLQGRAVVIGASFGGCSAARFLADHFAEVVMVERDVLPRAPAARRGVPQSRHLHGLLAAGLDLLVEHFPGVVQESVRLGAVYADGGATAKQQVALGILPRRSFGRPGLSASRALLEHALRTTVLELPNVSLLEGIHVDGLTGTAGRVTGVSLGRRETGATPYEGDELAADFVVEATGRVSVAPTWLARLGVGAPDDTEVNAFYGYASRRYKKPVGWSADWESVLLVNPISTPNGRPRGAAVIPQENDEWIVTLIGACGDYPPRDEQEFLAWARTLTLPDVAEVVEQGVPASEIAIVKLPANRWRHYEKLAALPEGLVLLGDAVCAFNPTYGQGMTTALMGGRILGETMTAYRRTHADLSGFGAHFQKALAGFVATPWSLSTGADYRLPGVEGSPQPRAAKLLTGYVDRLTRLSFEDPDVQQTSSEVFQLLKPPSALFSPRIAWPIVRGWKRLGTDPAPA